MRRNKNTRRLESIPPSALARGWNLGFPRSSWALCEISISIFITTDDNSPLPKSPLDSTLEFARTKQPNLPVLEDPVKRWSLIWEEDKAIISDEALVLEDSRSRRSVSYKYEKTSCTFLFFALFFSYIATDRRQCALLSISLYVVVTKLLLFFLSRLSKLSLFTFFFLLPVFILNRFASRLVHHLSSRARRTDENIYIYRERDAAVSQALQAQALARSLPLYIYMPRNICEQSLVITAKRDLTRS